MQVGVHYGLTKKQPSSGSNLNVHQQITRLIKYGLPTQWIFSTWHLLQHGWILNTKCWVRKASHKRPHSLWFYLCETSRTVKSIGTDGILVVAYSWEGWRVTAKVVRFLLERWVFWNKMCWRMHSSVNTLKPVNGTLWMGELYDMWIISS